MLINVQGLVVSQGLLVSLDVVKDCVFVFFPNCKVQFVFVIVDELLYVYVVRLRSLAPNQGFLDDLIWKLHLELVSRLLGTL